MCQNMWKNPPELPIDAGIIKTKKSGESVHGALENATDKDLFRATPISPMKR